MPSSEPTDSLEPILQSLILKHVQTSIVDVGELNSLREIGLDSMAMVELLLDIESELGISFPDELLTAETFSTYQSLLAAIREIRE